MRYRPLTLAVPILALALLAGAPAETWAQGRTRAQRGGGEWEARKLARHNHEVQQLLKRVGEARDLLLAEDHEAGLPVTAVLMQRLAPSIVKEDSTAFDLMGHLYTLHALALVGTGSDEEGLWHWGMARSLSDSVAGTPLEAYGEAGRRLAELSEGSENRCRSPAELAGKGDPDDEVPQGEEAGEGGGGDDTEPRPAESPVQPPVKVHAPAPSYTQAARWAGIEGMIILQGAIEESGRVGRVCVLRADAAVFAHVGAQALKRWRFKPATQDGEPTRTYYNITQNFTLH